MSKKLYLFRFPELAGVVADEENDCITRRWYGFAYVENMRDLFWQIDEHGDPSCVEIAPLPAASFCFLLQQTYDTTEEEKDLVDSAIEEHEFSCSLSCFEDLKWRKPVYPENVFNKFLGHKKEEKANAN